MLRGLRLPRAQTTVSTILLALALLLAVASQSLGASELHASRKIYSVTLTTPDINVASTTPRVTVLSSEPGSVYARSSTASFGTGGTLTAITVEAYLPNGVSGFALVTMTVTVYDRNGNVIASGFDAAFISGSTVAVLTASLIPQPSAMDVDAVVVSLSCLGTGC